MAVSSILTSLLVAVLSGFLALSTALEHGVVNVLSTVGYARPAVEYRAPSHENEEAPRETTEAPLELDTLPSEFENQQYGGAIPDILLTTRKSDESIILTATESGIVAGTSTATLVPKGKKDTPVADALVNVFCTLRKGNELRATTGSGVFIDPRGVILTNAHVAQFLLLKDKDKGIVTRCAIRTGNPAIARYEAELLYISPMWVNANAEELTKETPTGTGERDYALLYVTKAIVDDLPTTFPSLPLDIAPLGSGTKNRPVLAAGFPAESMRTDGPRVTLAPVIATTTIASLYTYTKNKIDLLGIAPSAVGEGGSSGGPIITLDGSVIGIISTKGSDERDGARSLRAIPAAYINRTIREEIGVDLATYLQDQLAQRAAIFNETLTPLLRSEVRDAITNRM